MVMQSISLHDTVTVAETAGEEIAVTCDRGDLPAGRDNIAWKAADVFFRAAGLPRRGLAITLEKRIPAQAGMAGGSADGAAVLTALRTLYAPALPNAALEELGAAVGSDVPFCLRGGTALAEGRGEVLTALPPLPDCWITLCKPTFGLSTPVLFGRVRAEALRGRPDHAAMERGLAEGDLRAVARQLKNVFEEVLTPEEGSEIRHLKGHLLAHGALNAVMTGSGPTVFGLFETERQARQAAESLNEYPGGVFVARPI
jgi:4-diphosphocytidyl-2-C-methyl-D-erythritol kinase